MTAIVETSTYTATITQLDTTDLVLGGVGGPSNRALVELANRTKWLYDRIASLTELPFSSLPLPTIATSTNKLINYSRAAGTAGGVVTVASGTLLALGEVVVSSATGRLRSFTTPTWSTTDLNVSSTYYLRAQVGPDSALLLYTQKGTDADAIPATKIGTPNGASGGGFDSTQVDMLIAKVVTGVAGSLPTVTPLANAPSLFAQTELTGTVLQDAGDGYAATYAGTLTLNWARTPRISTAVGSMRSPTVTGGVYMEGGANIIANRTVSRYAIGASVTTDWVLPTGNFITYSLNLSATT